jgi:tRNA(Ile2)-agmatinylcytidine synthase
VRKPSVKHPRLINVEKIDVVSLQKQIAQSNPICRECGLRMKSMGRDKGLRCTKCKTRTAGGKISRMLERRLEIGTYLASPRSQRHLTKQLIRYGKELDGRNSAMIEGWIGSRIVRPFPVPARSP